MTESKMTNSRIKLAGFRAHPNNYNQHDDLQIEGAGGLMDSLRIFGQVQAVVVWRDLLVAGHGVAEAARRLGWTELDARVIPEDWPERRVLAYLAADNELARAGNPDMAQLFMLTQELDDDLAPVAAGGEEALAELVQLYAESRLQPAGAGFGDRLGKAGQVIKLALYLTQLAVVEEAIALAATGDGNRGRALEAICEFYLESHDAETRVEASLFA